MPKAVKPTKAANRQKVITIRDDEADRVFDVTIHAQDRPEIITQKIRNETAVWPFFITNHKGGRVQYRYTDLKAGGGLTLHRNTKTSERQSRDGQRTSDKLPLILESWKLKSVDEIFGQDFAEIAPRLPKADASKATFKDLEQYPDDFPVLDPEKWTDRSTMELWKLSQLCSREYALVEMQTIVSVRQHDASRPSSQVIEALTVDVQQTKLMYETLMEDNPDTAVEVIRARGQGAASADMVIRSKDEEVDGGVLLSGLDEGA